MSELKPCPFCGGEATWANDDKNWIQCLYCRVETPWFDDEHDAIEAWNTRKPIDKVVKQLEENYSCDVGNLKMISLDKSIEIVKGGQND